MFVIFNSIEIGIPLILKWRAKRKHIGVKTNLEIEADMKGGEVQEDYSEIIVCLGYTLLFVMAQPLAPSLGLISIIIENKVDAYKFCKLVQRPNPDGAADIGIWQGIFEFMTTFGIISNCGLFFITNYW